MQAVASMSSPHNVSVGRFCCKRPYTASHFPMKRQWRCATPCAVSYPWAQSGNDSNGCIPLDLLGPQGGEAGLDAVGGHLVLQIWCGGARHRVCCLRGQLFSGSHVSGLPVVRLSSPVMSVWIAQGRLRVSLAATAFSSHANAHKFDRLCTCQQLPCLS